jgi:DNA-binding response OmpR family regulator
MTYKILLIDDDDSFTELVSARLQAAGYEVHTAPDAMMGLQAAHTYQPDLVLLDLKVPAGGGLSVLENLRKSIKTSQIPVIVVTGTADLKKKTELVKLGVKTYIQKPFTPEDLLQTISSTLQ